MAAALSAAKLSSKTTIVRCFRNQRSGDHFQLSF
jgi:hypothetical protein